MNGKDTGRSKSEGRTNSDHEDGEEWAGFDEDEQVTALHATKSTNRTKHDLTVSPVLQGVKKDKERKREAFRKSLIDPVVGQKATSDDANIFDALSKEVDDEVDGECLLLPELEAGSC